MSAINTTALWQKALGLWGPIPTFARAFSINAPQSLASLNPQEPLRMGSVSLSLHFPKITRLDVLA